MVMQIPPKMNVNYTIVIYDVIWKFETMRNMERDKLSTNRIDHVGKVEALKNVG